MATLYVMIGVPGSGKTTYATQHGLTVSSDKIREELYGDENIQGNPDEVFGLFCERIGEALAAGKDVYADSTNVTRWTRRSILKEAKRTGANAVAVVLTTKDSDSKMRNNLRSRTVPEVIIDRMRRRFEPPTIEEGFSEIIYVESELLTDNVSDMTFQAIPAPAGI